MDTKAVLKAVRGTRDLLPPETELWNRVEAVARGVFARYGFGEIRTPVFEDTALFARGVGEETDIVSKEMYTWEDRARAASEKAQSVDAAAGEYGWGGAGLYRTQDGGCGGAAEAVLYRAAVSAGEAAAGAVSGSSGRLGRR